MSRILFTGGGCLVPGGGIPACTEADTPQTRPPPRPDTPGIRYTPLEPGTPPGTKYTLRLSTPPGTKYTPLGLSTPPRPDTPPYQTPPPPSRHPLTRAPLQCRACCEIWSTCGRYASYWNAILYLTEIINNTTTDKVNKQIFHACIGRLSELY